MKATTKGKHDKKTSHSIPLPQSVRGLLNRTQVCEALGGCSLKKLFLMVRLGEFPQPDAHLGRYPRWSVDLVNEWCSSQRVKAEA